MALLSWLIAITRVHPVHVMNAEQRTGGRPSLDQANWFSHRSHYRQHVNNTWRGYTRRILPVPFIDPSATDQLRSAILSVPSCYSHDSRGQMATCPTVLAIYFVLHLVHGNAIVVNTCVASSKVVKSRKNRRKYHTVKLTAKNCTTKNVYFPLPLFR